MCCACGSFTGADDHILISLANVRSEPYYFFTSVISSMQK